MPDATPDQATGPQENQSGPEISSDDFRPLPSKLRPAQSHLPLVERTTLVDALARTRAQLILISAPAGAGKSTLLSQFAAADGRPAVWLQLDDADNDPVVLLSYLALALEQLAPVDPAILDLLRLRTGDAQRSLPRPETDLGGRSVDGGGVDGIHSRY